jgi:hypothetical protein
MKYSKLAEQFEQSKLLPLFEIPMVNGDYLLVNLSVKYKAGKSGSYYPTGLNFEFDQRIPVAPYKDLPVVFDGCITGKNGYYFYPFDNSFSIDEHLQEIYNNIVEGFLIANNLYNSEE